MGNVQVDEQKDIGQQNINIDHAENQSTPRNKQANARDKQAAHIHKQTDRQTRQRPKDNREMSLRSFRVMRQQK